MGFGSESTGVLLTLACLVHYTGAHELGHREAGENKGGLDTDAV